MKNAPQEFVRAQNPGQAGIRILQGKATQNQNDEAGQEQPVLQSLVRGQTHNGAHLPAPGNHFLAPYQNVVRSHSANREQDQRQIDPADDRRAPRSHVASSYIRD
jgi:hypothetical protein